MAFSDFDADAFLSLTPEELPVPVAHSYLLGSINPRPIALASTLSKDGVPNLAPFSYFNVFATRPATVVFSPNRSGKTGLQKDTALNLFDTNEVVINTVSYGIVEQMNLAATAYGAEVNEIEKAGLTPVASELVAPPRIAESPIQLECKVRTRLVVGHGGGQGNLMVCEVVRMHINKGILDVNERIDPRKADLVGRMGGSWYCRANGEALFELAMRPPEKVTGIDAFPDFIKHSAILTGNDLGRLSKVPGLPDPPTVQNFKHQEAEGKLKGIDSPEAAHTHAQALLVVGKVEEAWLVLLAAGE